MPSPTLHLLDWTQPLLDAVAAHLAAGWQGTGPLDLSDELLVVPTRRSGRRLREALAAHAAARGQAVFPPRVILPEQLVGDALTPATTASHAAMLVAWIEVLRGIRIQDFDAVFPVAPADPGVAWAARLGRQFIDLQAVLLENGLRMRDVPECAGPFAETRRWRQLAELESLFEAHLAAQGLASLSAARLAAAAVATPPPGVRRIVVAAVPDPMPLAVRRLEALADAVPVLVLVHGPSLAAFDSWGRPDVESWIHAPLPLPAFEEHVHPLADPAAQADAVVAIAREHLGSRPGPDAMLGIAVADREVLAPLHHGLHRAGLASYDPEGTPLARSELHRLLELLLATVEEPTFENAAALLRCPSVLEWLAHDAGPDSSAADLLAALDALRSTHLPATIADAQRQARQHRPRPGEVPWQPVAAALAAVEELRARAAGAFPAGVQSALASIHRHRRFQVSRGEDAAQIEAAEVWAEVARSTADAAGRLSRLSPMDTWRLALQQFGELRSFPDKPPGSIELQGWLELPWEDAPHLIVAGFNEGRIPAAVVGDAFLPEALRERLGLKTNAARLARDAYLLHAILSSRSDRGRVDILLGRTSAVGDPLRPSRLLLRCDDAELPERVDYLFREVPPQPGGSSGLAWRRAWQLAPPAPEAITTVSVTALRDHLACPFRFYLRHALRMREVDPHKEELDARDFGNLVHHALEGLYYEAAMRRCTDPEKVRDFLIDRFDQRARALYGTQVPVPLLVQLESARQRLAHAARVHASDTAAGWTIHAVEHRFTCGIGKLTVVGRIDRIDRHEPTGAVRVLDYKTFDQAKTPESTHTRKAPSARSEQPAPPPYAVFTAPDGRELLWLDLQLPLYRRALAPDLGEAIALGYFCLPKAATETCIQLWEGFDHAWQEKADHCVEGVAAAITDGVFWPPADTTPFTDEFARLFHEGAAASIAWSLNPRCAP